MYQFQISDDNDGDDLDDRRISTEEADNRHIIRHFPFSFSLLSWDRDFLRSKFNDIFRVLSKDKSSYMMKTINEIG